MSRKPFIRFTLILLVFFAVPVTTQATVAIPDGLYQVAGTNPDGTKYTGTVTVTHTGATNRVERVGKRLIFRVVWKIGGRVRHGTGLMTLGAVLSVGYNGGVASYRVWGKAMPPEIRLSGTWVPHGSTKIGREVWTHQPVK